jgi:hypothetical protein
MKAIGVEFRMFLWFLGGHLSWFLCVSTCQFFFGCGAPSPIVTFFIPGSVYSCYWSSRASTAPPVF